MGILKSVVPFIFKKNYYILRFSSFARSGNIKLLYTFITLLLCLNNYEYYLLYLISSISWGAIEMFLQIIGVRKISSMFLLRIFFIFYFNFSRVIFLKSAKLSGIL